MIVIYKFELTNSVTYVNLAENSKIKHCGEQNGKVHMWVETNTTKVPIYRTIRIIGTGQETPDNYKYVSTVQMSDGFVWHIYEDII